MQLTHPGRVTFVLLLAGSAFCLHPTSGAAQEGTDRVDALLAQVVAFEMTDPAGPLEELERIVFQLAPDSPARGAIEQKLVDALRSASPVEARRYLCRLLHTIGTARCVPALEELLTDPALSHPARYALGRLEDPAAGEALVRSLPRTTGSLQAGIIDSLGERRCEAARAEIAALLGDADPVVATSAARALGRLGGQASADVLLAARSSSAAPLRAEIDNGLLQVAEQWLAAGERESAASLYERLDVPEGSPAQRFAALRGVVAARPGQAVERLLRAMQSGDTRLARHAISLVPQVRGEAATQAFVAAFDTLTLDDQVLLLRALGDRGDVTAQAALIAATGHEQAPIRAAALRSLGQLGDAAAVPVLLSASAQAPGEEQHVARAALRVLADPDTEAALRDALHSADARLRVEAIKALAVRRGQVAPDELLTAARDRESAVRLAAAEALGTLAGPGQLSALVDLVAGARQPSEREALTEALDRVLSRMADRRAGTEATLAALARAPQDARPVLIELLAIASTPEGLQHVRKTLTAGDAQLADAAVRALANWRSEEASDDLLSLVDKTRNNEWRAAALQGYLRLAATADDPARMYLLALSRVQRVNDRRAVLDGLGLSSDSLEALNLTLGYLEDEALQASAGVAAIRIAYRIRQQHEREARLALRRVLATVRHPDVQQRARDVVNEIDKFEDHILQWVTVGPYQEDGKDGGAIYATTFKPESDPDGVDWQPLTKGIGSWDINLEATYGALDFCAAYLRTRVWSSQDQSAQLEMGCDDSVKAWLNGELVHEQWGEGAAAPRQRLVPVRLKQGWNDLMLKVVDQQGGWVAAARIRQPDGSALQGLKIEAR